MRIYTKAGDLAFSTLRFPDGQPHFRLETYDREFESVTIERRITSPLDLFEIGLIVDVLRQQGYNQINLDVPYLMGARMDRAISSFEPHTLQVVARQINALGLSQVRILDAHSEVALRLIRNSQNVLPWHVFQQVDATLGFPTVVCPDKGATERVKQLYSGYIVYCTKTRNQSDGKLSFFGIENGWEYIKNQNCLIVDDICDGGATFLGLAEVLRKAGAKSIYLYVTHGIFSKGALDPALIEHTYTTNSFRDVHELGRVTTIPISMEKL